LNPYKKLGGQAIVYGLGNIVPRLLNYAVLTFYYSRRFSIEEFGVITELYAYVAILLVLLTYGMETGLFKFSVGAEKRDQVFSTSMISVITTSVLFAVLVLLWNKNIAGLIGYKGNPEYIVYLGLTLSLDAVASIAFARLRIENKVRRFATLKIVNVIITIFFVFLFLEVLPSVKIIASAGWYTQYFKSVEVGYVFIANLLASLVVLILLMNNDNRIKFTVNPVLLKKILIYSLPLLVSGLAGIFNETIDRILLRFFSADNLTPLHEIGIYGANYRIAVLLTIFVQMFRYAAEPFFFNLSKELDSKEVYANVLKYFTIFMMIIFLCVSLGIDFFKLFIDSKHHEGLSIVPVVLMANVFVGMLFNVNMWYKITGQTIYGVYITCLGALITIVMNILLIPVYSYHACAWIHLVSNFVMLILTYMIGQRFYKVNYPIGKISFYVLFALLLYFIGTFLRTEKAIVDLAIGFLFVSVYFVVCNKRENLINVFLGKK
jgi:O-antigen/teichoic acid export membrane protein